MNNIERGRFPRRRPLLTRVPRVGTAVAAPGLVPPSRVVSRGAKRGSKGLCLRLAVPLAPASPPPAPPVVPRGSWVVRQAPPPRGARVIFTRLPAPAGPAPAADSRRFRLPARADVNPQVRARADSALARRACATMSISSNLSWFRGEDVTIDFTMAPVVDVSGWTVVFTLKDQLGGSTQSGFPITATIVDGPRGKFRLAVPSSATSSIPVGRYVWDCRRTDSGNRTTVADGYLDLKQECTP